MHISADVLNIHVLCGSFSSVCPMRESMTVFFKSLLKTLGHGLTGKI